MTSIPESQAQASAERRSPWDAVWDERCAQLLDADEVSVGLYAPLPSNGA